MFRKIVKFFSQTEVRRYNFICEGRLLYSGLFTKRKYFDSCLFLDLEAKRKYVSTTQGMPKKFIQISNTIKG